MPSKELAMRSTALVALFELHRIKEIDDYLQPVGKDAGILLQQIKANSEKEPRHSSNNGTLDNRPGTTKRRQYYYKQVAKCLSHEADEKDKEKPKVQRDSYFLYALQLRLTCAIPEDQNTRGRKIYSPEDAKQKFGILVREEIPPVSEFPIYTRSGEVFVTSRLMNRGAYFTDEELEKISTFHEYTFSKVLRLVKYPMLFSPSESENAVMVLPLMKTEDEDVIDWNFLDKIGGEKDFKLNIVPDEERKDFKFDEEDYSDAVIMPWYRNQDQPQYFYVAEICRHLSPTSDFPGHGFESFEKYYNGKYNINIQNLEQPLLDVDHTSARLNFLTPRYVNRKGVALPTSSEETKRNKRENLDQKQILVPELCAVHPFPASLWRQTVCLPCILYRLNGLLIANQLRAVVSLEGKIGVPAVANDYKWPALTFGWTLADVLINRKSGVPKTSESKTQKCLSAKSKGASSKSNETPESKNVDNERNGDDELGCLTSKLMSKLNEEESKLKLKSDLEIGTWSNDMARNTKFKNADEEDFEEMDMFDPNVALPDNLTFLDSSTLPSTGGGTDWGTGIAQRPFRVGSPTFFSNPNINIPGLMDDFDRFSCSDVSDDDREEPSVVRDGEDVGNVRIEFHGDNIAEAIEDEAEKKKRVENMARDVEELTRMVRCDPWVFGDRDDFQKDPIEKEIEKEMEANLSSRIFMLNTEDSFNKEFEKEVKKVPIPEKEDENGVDIGPICEVFQSELLCHAGDGDAKEESIIRTADFGVIPSPEDDEIDFSFDLQPDLAGQPGPSPSLILQALTMSNSNDAINLERLETIGDSFLKYATTSYLFCVNSSVHEGRLSHLRSKYVSNLNLYRLGRKKGLGQFMIATKFEPHDNWLPPCYHVPREIEQALIQSGVPSTHWNMAELPNLRGMKCEEICNLVREKNTVDSINSKNFEKVPSFIPYNLLTQHSIPDKSIADCVEALIGAYLIACGPKGGLLLMNWFGLDLLTRKKEDVADEDCLFTAPPSPLLPDLPNPEKHLNTLLSGFEEFEDIIGYRFKDRSYLLQAFSHASYYPNRLTDCYQRLEFLGDAVLDYLITRHLFEDRRQHSPGALTDLRSALVNNTIFASLAVKYDFHKYFKHFSPGLQQVINRFVKLQKEEANIVSEEFFLLGEDDPEEAEDIEVPKALGDIFESVAGAIYLDSNLRLDPVWTVYYRMMKKEIDMFSNNVPKSPIRELLELEPETAKFGKPEKLADGRRVRVSVEVFGKGIFKGIGRNYRIAKCTAAKCALRAIKKTATQGQ